MVADGERYIPKVVAIITVTPHQAFQSESKKVCLELRLAMCRIVGLSTCELFFTFVCVVRRQHTRCTHALSVALCTKAAGSFIVSFRSVRSLNNMKGTNTPLLRMTQYVHSIAALCCSAWASSREVSTVRFLCYPSVWQWCNEGPSSVKVRF